MRKTLFLFLTILNLSCLIFAQQPPIQIILNEQKNVRNNVKYLDVNLIIQNPHDVPVWYVIPGFAEDKIDIDGIFEAKMPWSMVYISGNTFSDYVKTTGETPKRYVQIHFIGKNMSFYTFKVPPKSSITLNHFSMKTFRNNLNEVEIWEASDLLINDEGIGLEKYLLYETLCTPDLVLDIPKIQWLNVDWQKQDRTSPLLQTPIYYIKAIPLAKRKVEIKRP